MGALESGHPCNIRVSVVDLVLNIESVLINSAACKNIQAAFHFPRSIACLLEVGEIRTKNGRESVLRGATN
jgi:hypothetical protein